MKPRYRHPPIVVDGTVDPRHDEAGRVMRLISWGVQDNGTHLQDSDLVIGSLVSSRVDVSKHFAIYTVVGTSGRPGKDIWPVVDGWMWSTGATTDWLFRRAHA